MKGRLVAGQKRFGFQRALVVVQFAVSSSLIVATLVIYAQLDFVRSRHLGFDIEQVVTVNFRKDSTVVRQYEAIKAAMAEHPAVRAVSISDFIPGSPTGATTAHIEGGQGRTISSIYPYGVVDYDFIPAYGIEMAAGRNFSRDFSTDDTEAFIVNEAATRNLGFASPSEALGKRVQQWGRDGSIVGVMQDFNFRSLHSEIEPLMLHIRPPEFRYLSMRIRIDDLPQTISDVSQIWQAFVPNRPFEYAFVDDAFDRQYQADDRFGQLIVFFAGLAIFIACLGLFGLAAYSIQRRTKEVGVRKVLGASARTIVVMFCSEYGRLILLSFAIAAPLAYLAMRHWLSSFAYRVPFNPLWFVAAGIAVLGIALATVGYHAVRAATANPVDTLRYE